jgi:putative membrane protein insertion efficiency factor
MPAPSSRPALARLAAEAARRWVALPIHVYRWSLKPLLGHECRHLPTCSEYALDAIARNGAWRGAWLALSRLCRCHPWGTHGFDPAPDLSDKHHPLAPWRYGVWRADRRGR